MCELRDRLLMIYLDWNERKRSRFRWTRLCLAESRKETLRMTVFQRNSEDDKLAKLRSRLQSLTDDRLANAQTKRNGDRKMLQTNYRMVGYLSKLRCEVISLTWEGDCFWMIKLDEWFNLKSDDWISTKAARFCWLLPSSVISLVLQFKCYSDAVQIMLRWCYSPY